MEIRCLQGLCTLDPFSHKESIAPRVSGTCSWFLQNQKYRHWLETQGSSLLWASGDPGCGKTVLSSFLIDELKGNEAQPSPWTICFFFCDDKIEAQRDAKAILRGVIHQLFKFNRVLISHAIRLFESDGLQMVNQLGTLWKILIAA